nr:hypothetical protein [Tanacetum cinerariifolium]
HVVDEAVHKELGNSLVRAATTASSLEVEQDNGAKKPWEILTLKLGLRVFLKIPMIHCSQEGRRIDAIDQDEDNTLVNVQDDAEMFNVKDFGDEEVFLTEQEVVKDVNENVVEEVLNDGQDSTATTIVTTEEITLAQALKA